MNPREKLRRSSTFNPRLEALEERWAPAVNMAFSAGVLSASADNANRTLITQHAVDAGGNNMIGVRTVNSGPSTTFTVPLQPWSRLTVDLGNDVLIPLAADDPGDVECDGSNGDDVIRMDFTHGDLS